MRTPRVLSTLLLGIAGVGTVLALASGAVTGAVFHAEATASAEVTTARLGLEFGNSFQHESIALSAVSPMQRTEIALTNTSNTGRFPLAIAVTESQATDSAPVSLAIYDGTCALRSSATAEGAIWSWNRLGDAPSGPGLGDATAPTIAEGATRTFCAEFSLVGTPTDAIELGASLSFTGWVSTFTTNPLTWTMPVAIEAAGDEPGEPEFGDRRAPLLTSASGAYVRCDSDTDCVWYEFDWYDEWIGPWDAPDVNWVPTSYRVTWSGQEALDGYPKVLQGHGDRSAAGVSVGNVGPLTGLNGTFTIVGLDENDQPATLPATVTFTTPEHGQFEQTSFQVACQHNRSGKPVTQCP